MILKNESSTSYLQGKKFAPDTSQIVKSLLYTVLMGSIHTISGNDYFFSKMQQHMMNSCHHS